MPKIFMRHSAALVVLVLVAGLLLSYQPASAQLNCGNFVAAWGSSGTANGQFNAPAGLSTDASGLVYVADTQNHRIQKFSSTGGFLTAWGSFGAGSGEFNTPEDVAVDGSGNVYVADRLNHRIQKFSSTGTFVTAWGSLGTADGEFRHPEGVGTDASGNVYVADRTNHRIQKFMSDGTWLAKFGSFGTANGEFSDPSDVAVDASGNIYVADALNHRIQKFDSSFGWLAAWGSLGTGNGQFNIVSGITADSSGNILATDQLNHRVQVFNSAGTFQGAWGFFGTGNGQFNSPAGVARDASGNVYVADSANNRIQKFNCVVGTSTPMVTPTPTPTPLMATFYFELRKSGAGVNSQQPVVGADLIIFDLNDPGLLAAYGKEVKGSELQSLYENPVGDLDDCTTGTDGTCSDGVLPSGRYLVIGKFQDPETPFGTVYIGEKKNLRAGQYLPEDDDDEDNVGIGNNKFLAALNVVKKFKNVNKVVVFERYQSDGDDWYAPGFGSGGGSSSQIIGSAIALVVSLGVGFYLRKRRKV